MTRILHKAPSAHNSMPGGAPPIQPISRAFECRGGWNGICYWQKCEAAEDDRVCSSMLSGPSAVEGPVRVGTVEDKGGLKGLCKN